MRLIVYIESPHHLQWLMENLCFNAAPEERDGASLRTLLSVKVLQDEENDDEFEAEEFHTDSQFKTIREHLILFE